MLQGGKGGPKGAGSKSSKDRSKAHSRLLEQTSEHGNHNWYFSHMELHDARFPAEGRSIGTGNDRPPDSEDYPKIPYCEEPPLKKKSKSSEGSTRSKLHKSKTSKTSKSPGKGSSKSDRSKLKKSESSRGSKSDGKGDPSIKGSLKSRSKQHTQSKMKGKGKPKIEKKAKSANESTRSKLQKTASKDASKSNSDRHPNGINKKQFSTNKAEQRLYLSDSFINDTDASIFPEVSPVSPFNPSTILSRTPTTQFPLATTTSAPYYQTAAENGNGKSNVKAKVPKKGDRRMVRNLRHTLAHT